MEFLLVPRANWPSKWREETQLARQTWQEAEERRVKDAHTIGKIFLVSVLAFVIYGCSSQSSATSEPTDTAETISGVPQLQIKLTDGMRSPEWPMNGTYDVRYLIRHGSDTCFLWVEAIERESNNSTDMISEVLLLDQDKDLASIGFTDYYNTVFDWDAETFSGGYYAFQASGACGEVNIELKKRW